MTFVNNSSSSRTRLEGKSSADLWKEIEFLQAELERKDDEIRDLMFRLAVLEHSFPVRAGHHFNNLLNKIIPSDSKWYRVRLLAAKSGKILLDSGFRTTWQRICRYLGRRGLKEIIKEEERDQRFQAWLAQNEPTLEQMKHLSLESEGFEYKPLISIVMPVYNVDGAWLKTAINSVQKQLYSNWELCIADDASTKLHVQQVLAEESNRDSRIKVISLSENKGIVGATTAALSLAGGEYVGFLDHDDELAPTAIFEVVKYINLDRYADVIYSDECILEVDGRKTEPYFKPDFSPDLLMSMNYIGHFLVVRRGILDQLGGLRESFEGSQDYDLVLRASEITKRVAHIPRILYYWRRIPGSTSGDSAAKPQAYAAAADALQKAVMRRGEQAIVDMPRPGRYHVHYQVRGEPLLSIIIPTRDKGSLLKRCIDSITMRSTYKGYEILVIDNQSSDDASLVYLDGLTGQEKIRVLRYDAPFNWSAINNFGVREALGEYLLFLNNDVEVITSNWLEEMLGHAQRAGTGAVGAKLLFPNNTIQHAGVIVGQGGVAGHAFYGLPLTMPSYMDYAEVTRNVSAVTGACLLTKRSLFNDIGGLSEGLPVSYNDVDYCLKVIQHGLFIVFAPHALLYHYESASRQSRQPEKDTKEFLARWANFLDRGDPFFSVNLDLNSVDFKVGYTAR